MGRVHRWGPWVVALSALAAALWGAGVGRSGWRLGAGAAALQLPELGAEVFFLHEPALVRAGPARLVVVRFARPVQFVPYTYATAGLPGPASIEAWARAVPAAVLFNAGQFDEYRNHLGWLKARNVWLSRQRKPAWKGLLVSGPLAGGPLAGGPLPSAPAPSAPLDVASSAGRVDGAARAPLPSGGTLPAGPWAQVVDLTQQDAAVAERYAHVLQSMMLVDEDAKVRVRRSETAACRTVVAQDRQGRMLVLLSEGAVTLHDLAAWLPTSGLQVVRAMNLDGGVESQLAVVTPQAQLLLYGQYGSDARLLHVPQATATRAPLPAVVAVFAGEVPPPPPDANGRR